MGWTPVGNLRGPQGPAGSDAPIGPHEAAADPHPQYMTAAEVATAITGKANTVHTHAIADVTSLQAALDAKAADSAVVHNTGAETINGAKTFGTAPAVPVGNLVTHPVRRDDARLTDARTPLAHAASHVPGGTDALTGYIAASTLGQANGPASLDSGGKLPQAQLPAIALTEFLGAVGSQAAMLALSGQRGDWASRTDLGVDYQLIAEPSSTLANWRAMTYPASPVSSVNGRTGPVTGLAEAADVTSGLAGKANTSHGHVVSDVTGLQAALDAKSATGHTHAVSNVTGLQAELDAKMLATARGASNGVGSLVSGKQPLAELASHAHDAADVSVGTLNALRLPRVMTALSENTTASAGTYNVDANGAAGAPLRLKFILNHDSGLNTISNPVDGQILRVVARAVTATRNFVFPAAVRTSTGITSRTVAIPAGQVMLATMEYESGIGAWILASCTVSAT